jgi:hypothetical protein
VSVSCQSHFACIPADFYFFSELKLKGRPDKPLNPLDICLDQLETVVRLLFFLRFSTIGNEAGLLLSEVKECTGA